ncbi:hypothetical protein DFH08DRAFT_514510 [Mycena albidolilacea]|uniref:DUF6534 domain-containing protein n=1 Tax=Mycena albidolilacea TaxID=1033008 RepID=A0AAD6Z3S9_9AGAR|nr:hypothetical protein DFH08DRAFT_514510 [Mycena albidolilacea]
MSDPVPPEVRHTLANLLGPWLIGLVLSSIIFGITCLQVYLYYTKFSSRDSVFLKVFVAVLMIMDIVHITLLTLSYYVTTVDNFGNFEAIQGAPWSLQAQIVVGVFLSTLVQQFYAFRIYVLANKSPWIPAMIVICSLSQLSFAIAYMVKALENPLFTESKVVIPFSTSALAFETACNILVAGSMVFLLAQNRTDFRKTNRAVNTLIAYMVNSGLLIAIFAISCLVTFLTSTTTLIYGLFFFVLVRLYGCSFMSILNSRDSLREQLYKTNTDHAMVTIPTYTDGSSQDQHSQSTKRATESAIVWAKDRSEGTVV